MTKKKLEELAKQHIQSNYATWTNCSEVNLKYNSILAELKERTQRVASGDCKNRAFSKNDCKREQEVYIPLLQAAATRLGAARNKCIADKVIPAAEATQGFQAAAQALAAKVVEENTKIVVAAQAAEAAAIAAGESVEEETPKVNFMLIGGIAVAAIVAVILLRRK
jgi:phosphoribosyl-ATP pyrophosphohydrolase